MGELKKRRITRILLFLCLLTLIWMAVIFSFSAQNANASGKLSIRVLRKLLSWFHPRWAEMTSAEHTVVILKLNTAFRKAGHFSEYCVLGFLLSAVGRNLPVRSRPSRQSRVLRTLLLPALLALTYAGSDELHQKFVSGRSCELRDVCIDFGGACLGILLAALFAHLRRKRRKAREAVQGSD